MVELASAPTPEPLTNNRRYSTLLLLTVVFAVSLLHRQILSLLLHPIGKELSFNDTELGLLSGSAFIFVNVVLGIPVARLADRWSRRKVIALAASVAGVMTIFCGMAQSFATLLLARLGVGAGWSGGTAPIQALVGDLFPRGERATAMAILLLAVPLGLASAYFCGGWALGSFGWRKTLVMAGVPGLVLGAIALVALPERQAKALASAAAPQLPLGATIRLLWSIRSLRNMMIASTLQTFLQMGLPMWIPSYLMRSYNMSPSTIGTGMALAFGIGVTVGNLVGGRLTDVLGRRDLRWHFRIPAVAVFFAAGLCAAAFVVPPRYIFFLIGAQIVFGTLFSSSLSAITQSLVPTALRATAIACLLFVINLVSTGIGPQLMGIASDLLRPAFSDDALRLTLLGSSLMALPAAFFFHKANATYRADIAAADMQWRVKTGDGAGRVV